MPIAECGVWITEFLIRIPPPENLGYPKSRSFQSISDIGSWIEIPNSEIPAFAGAASRRQAKSAIRNH
jgi:hypothetical protein